MSTLPIVFLSVTGVMLLVWPRYGVEGYGSGAPRAACHHVAPQHIGVSGQTTVAPYHLSLPDGDTHTPGRTITGKPDPPPTTLIPPPYPVPV